MSNRRKTSFEPAQVQLAQRIARMFEIHAAQCPLLLRPAMVELHRHSFQNTEVEPMESILAERDIKDELLPGLPPRAHLTLFQHGGIVQALGDMLTSNGRQVPGSGENAAPATHWLFSVLTPSAP
jgi:hypothetical protein